MTNILNPWAQLSELKKENEALREHNIRLQVDCAAMAKRFNALRSEVEALRLSIDGVIEEGQKARAVKQIMAEAAKDRSTGIMIAPPVREP